MSCERKKMSFFAHLHRLLMGQRETKPAKMSDNTKKIIYLCREYAVTVAKLTRCGAKGAKVVRNFRQENIQ